MSERAHTCMPYHHGDLRRVLLAAAVRSLRRGGTSALSLRALARKAGVSAAAPYRHFPTKKALLDALADEGYTRLLAAVNRALARHPGHPRRQFQAAAQAYLRFSSTHPEWVQLMYTHSPLGQGTFLALADRPQADFMHVIRSGQERGDIASGDLLDLTVTAYAFLRGLASLRLERNFRGLWSSPRVRAAWIARLTDWFWFGLARRPRTRGRRRVPSGRDRP